MYEFEIVNILNILQDANYLQAVLQPSAKEILEAVRAIFLQVNTHISQKIHSHG